MAMKKRKPLARPGEPTQTTPQGLDIPMPQRGEFFGGLKRAARRQAPRKEPSDEAQAEPSQSDPGTQ